MEYYKATTLQLIIIINNNNTLRTPNRHRAADAVLIRHNQLGKEEHKLLENVELVSQANKAPQHRVQETVLREGYS
jgi:hypothetical protein